MQRFNLLGEDRQWRDVIDGRRSKSALWEAIDWNTIKRSVNRLQTRIVKAVKNCCRVPNGTLSMLEPCEVKTSRRVLRGEGGRKAAFLPGGPHRAVREDSGP